MALILLNERFFIILLRVRSKDIKINAWKKLNLDVCVKYCKNILKESNLSTSVVLL